jgi:hypothetical protein
VLLWLAFVLVLLVLLFSVPVSLWFRIQHDGDWQARLQIRWLFGLVRLPIAPSKKKPVCAKKARKKSGSGVPTGVIGFVRRARLGRLIRRMTSAIRVRDFQLSLRLAPEDPFTTGMMWAAMGPANAVFSSSPRIKLNLLPQFSGEPLAFDSRGEVSVIPAQIAGILLWFLLSPTTLRAAWHQFRPV